MRLRFLLLACVGLALVVAGTCITLVAADAREAEVRDREQADVERIARNAAGLLVLAQDYVLHASPRAARQWRLVYRELDRTLEDYPRDGSTRVREADGLREIADGLPDLFGGLESAMVMPDGPRAYARRETLADQLVGETRRISDGAFDMSAQLNEERRALAAVQRLQTLIAQGSLLSLALILAWLILRRVLRPIDRLQAAAQAVEAGDLSVRSSYQAADELGRLSQAFNAMTTALQEREMALQVSNKQLARSEAFQARAGRIAGVGGWELDLASNRLYWTEQTYVLHGVDPGYEPHLDTVIEFYDPGVRPLLRAAIEAATSRGESWDLDLPFTTATGRARRLRCTGTPEFDGGRVVRLVGALRDITARHEANEALRRAKREAETANAAKSLFLANMSHEIRTPINAVVGLAYLLQQTALDADQQALLRKIGGASRSLLDVINDVLDVSKIEAGEMALEEAPFEPVALLDEIVGMMIVQAQDRGLDLALEVGPGLPAVLRGDAARLRQILVNLLSNAIKFTERGRVRLAVEVLEADGDTSTEPLNVRFIVEDSGIGIEPEALDHLFTPFTQADASTTRRFGGTGLGLSIVKRLSELMGGEVAVSSRVGVGSGFTVTLPLVDAGETVIADPALAPIEVLIAEDHDAHRELLLALSRRLGWRAEAVASGEALLKRVLARRRAGQTPDVLLIDGNLPGFEGLQMRARLHEDEPGGAVPSVVVIAAPGSPAVLQMPHADRVDAVLETPVRAPELFAAVHASVSRHGGDADRVLMSSALDVAGVAQLPGARLLVVDDSAINLEVAQRLLEGEGALVTLARDGADAVVRLRASPQGFDAVLMDVQMPVLDGLEASRRIRGELGLRTLPIIALTAGALLSERQRALDAGMDDFISKPFDPRTMASLLRRRIEAARGSRLPLAPRPTRWPALLASSWPSIDGIDGDEVRVRLEGDLLLFSRLLRQLCDEFGDLATDSSATETSLTPADRIALAARVHRLAGSAGLLGAVDLHAAAMAADRALRAEAAEDGPVLGVKLAGLRRTLRRLLDATRPWLERAAEPPLDSLMPDSSAGPVDPAALAELQNRLRAQDLDALARFADLAPALRRAWPAPRVAALQVALEQLDFPAALQLLVAASDGTAEGVLH